MWMMSVFCGKYLNQCHPLIKFSAEKNQFMIHYLDVEVKKSQDQFITTFYTKETDRNNLLNYDSYHAPQTLKGIPKAQFIRARRICSNDSEYLIQMEKLIAKFVQRGYPRKAVERVGMEVSLLSRDYVRSSKPKRSQERIFFISRFDKHAHLIKKTFVKHWSILTHDPNKKPIDKGCCGKRESHKTVTFRPSNPENLPPTIISTHTALNSSTNKENTTWDHITITERNQTGGATIAQIATVPIPTTNSTQESSIATSKIHITGKIVKHVSSVLTINRDSGLTLPTPTKQERYITFTLRRSKPENLPSTHTALNTETSKTSTEQENITWDHIGTTGRNRTGGLSITQIATVNVPTINSSQETPSATRKTYFTSKIVENASPVLTTNSGKSLALSTPSKQETSKNLHPRTSSRWQTSQKVPFLYISTADSNQETPSATSKTYITSMIVGNVTPVLNTNSGKGLEALSTPTKQENATWDNMLTSEITGTAIVAQSTSVPFPATNSTQESPITTSKIHITSKIVEYVILALTTNRDKEKRYQGMDFFKTKSS
ncbi:uncharacterized protein [Engystomops pustulosus]|uniref:uncharacterized protein n=1 Tax=Engystomops pustulosus TaxID=76066 RepID=UPI003AFADA47